MPDADLEIAKKSIRQALEALKITRVVCVDDDYPRFNHADAIGICVEIGPEKSKSIAGLESIPFDSHEDVWKEKFKMNWDGLTEPKRIAIGTALRAAKGDEPSVESISTLAELLDFCELKELLPSEWDAQKQQLIEESATKITLFLFDRHLSGEGENDGKDAGIKLLEEAIESEKTICGILSSTIQIDEEYEQWNEFIAEHNIPADRFVLISKEHLEADESKLGFARMIKLAVLNSPCKQLADLVVQAIKSGVADAHKDVSEIRIYDFEDIVFRKSRDEGEWEPDTLYRIFGLFQKGKVRQQIKGNTDIQKLVQKIRSVLDIQTHTSFSSRPTSWKIQRMDWYEDAADLNAHNVPISLGDIFEKPGGKRFVLLAQPCDLMIRSDGKRAYGLSEVYLAEIFKSEEHHDGEFELKYFDQNDGTSHFVRFGFRHAVFLDMLDLCAINADGVARYIKEMKAPEIMIRSLKERIQKLSGGYEAAIAKISALEYKQRTKEAVRELTPPSSSQALFASTFEAKPPAIVYQCKRVGRISSPYSDALLSAFCAHLSRPAFAVDFAREAKNELPKESAEKAKPAKAKPAKAAVNEEHKHEDKYNSIVELKGKEPDDNYSETEITDRNSWLIVVAPHGGQIEPHTDAIATKLAGDKFNLIVFRGLIPDEEECYNTLHVDSRKFRTPALLKLQDQAESKLTLSVHGLKDRDEGPKEVVWIGGKKEVLRERLSSALVAAGFSAIDAVKEGMSGPLGRQNDNFINLKSEGIQLEISRSMRNMLAETPERLNSFGGVIIGVLEGFAKENAWHAIEDEKSSDASSKTKSDK